jgi:guanine deaminase
MNPFMEVAIQESKIGLRSNHGGPFGAVIAQSGKIIAQAHNQVLLTNDPTAHAEILAIREASRKLRRFDLSDCEIYSTCEPCPMCFAAIHWAKLTKLYFGCTREDAASIGFDDKFIYDVIRGTADVQQVQQSQIQRPACLHAFDEWKAKTDKEMY